MSWASIRASIRRGGFMLLCWIGLFGIRAGLTLVGYRRLVRLLLRISPEPHRKSFAPRARAAALLIERTRSWRLKPPGSCLHRSILLWWYLRWLGIASQIQTGVRHKPDGALDLHAWVVQGGVVINDRLDAVSTYTPLWSALQPETIAKREP